MKRPAGYMLPGRRTANSAGSRDLRLRHHCAAFAALPLLASLFAPPAAACGQPDQWSIAATFDLVANGVYAPVKSATPLPQVPATLLKAIGWVESGWRQFTSDGRPLVSPDFGYGVMQVTSGMPGAFGQVSGSIAPVTASKIASEYRYNIAYGRSILQQKWASTPRIGDGDPSVIENWYFAIWAYNGWGWVNNPNNPRFARTGTPATDPAAFPYQERVLYLVAHPPRDRQGNPLWPAIPVTLPSRRTIGTSPHSFQPRKEHRAPPVAVGAVYQPAALKPAAPGASQQARIHLINTGTKPWIASGANAVVLTYHIFTRTGDPWGAVSPFTPGVVAFGQHPSPLPHDVLPGQSVTLTVPVLAPAAPGTYRIVWDLEQGVSSWLSQAGVLPRSQYLQVGDDASTPEPASPTPTPIPLEGLLYVRDTSVPDGSTVAPHQVLTKGWLVFNEGQTEWTMGWTLRHVSGKPMGAKTIPVPATAPCHSANIVGSLTAPAKPGKYTSAWQLVDPSGTAVGEKLTVVITVVGGPPPPTPTPSPTPTPTSVRVTPTPTPAG